MGLTPKDLELDVTETMLAYATWAYIDVLERLQQLGVMIAIDDFGTQYSSLDYLKHYRVSRLKIPRAMITAAAHKIKEMRRWCGRLSASRASWTSRLWRKAWKMRRNETCYRRSIHDQSARFLLQRTDAGERRHATLAAEAD